MFKFLKKTNSFKIKGRGAWDERDVGRMGHGMRHHAFHRHFKPPSSLVTRPFLVVQILLSL